MHSTQRPPAVLYTYMYDPIFNTSEAKECNSTGPEMANFLQTNSELPQVGFKPTSLSRSVLCPLSYQGSSVVESN